MALKETAGLYETLKAEWNKKNPNLSFITRTELFTYNWVFTHQATAHFSTDELPEAAYMHQLLGLNLLFLLSQNRVSEFHTELERLSAKDIQTNVYIRHPVSLEQYLMEGSYNKVFLAKGNIPAESYTFFIDILLDTIRDEIAGCIEKAYEQIQFSEATRVLFFSSPKKMTEYAKKRKWTLSTDGYYSFTNQQQRTEEVNIPSTELAQQVIEYARQLEMIV
ncbi:hypothetical protein WMY93_029208 [Mugilogobius chulae]|uniref:26S proteasome non-ATPase regulatory subunit 8 n=1 Tax=Mugilogobius chulae TaxID=88201 RepID=A0AAW0MUQ7_9GOBI